MPDDRTSAAPAPSIRVWDLPTRLFHWSLAVLVIAAIVAVKIGGNALVWHFRLGYAILALVAFRLVWGLVGGRYARFSSFLFSPGRILAYLRGAPDAPRTPGHNPLGGLSVLGLLAVTGFQAVSGLFANDDIASEGPLAKLVSGAASNLFTTLHRLNETLIFLLVGLHVAAIVFYRLRKGRNLVPTMVHGDGPAEPGTPPSRDDAGLRLRAVVVFAVCATAVWYLVAVVGGAPAGDGY